MGGCKGGGLSRLATLVVALGVGGIAAAAALGGSVSYSALNWGGYAALPAQNQSFTSVTSTFTVPQLDCTGTAGQRVGGTLLELWSALDGAYQPGVPVSIEQVGVEPGCHNGVQSNPTSYMVTFAKKTGKSVTVFGQITLNGGIDVPTGDSITATASHSGTTVILTLRDNGTGASGSFSTTCPKASCAYRSAEAILEAPGATAAFGTVSFTGSSVTDSAGHTGGLLTSGPWWNTEDLTLVGQAVPGGRLVPCETTGPYDTGSGGFVLTSSGGCISS